MEPVLSLRALNVKRKEVSVISSFDLDLQAGEFVYLSGPVGSGKSTLLAVLYGDIDFTAEKATLLGFDLKNISGKKLVQLRRKLGIISAEHNLLDDLTVEENLAIVGKATKFGSKAQISQRISEIIKLAELEGLENRYPHELSSGQRQNLVIGRALFCHPQFILADEPTRNLDTQTRMAVGRFLEKCAKEENITVILATHSLELMNSLPHKTISILETANAEDEEEEV